MAEEPRPNIHTMPMETLRARTREAQRILEQARTLVRASFDGNAPDSGGEKQVGGMLDAIERLMPGIGLLAVQRANDRARGKHDSGMLVPTPREKTREQIDRAEMIAATSDALAALLEDVERGRSAVMKAIEPPPSTLPPTWPKA